MAAVPDDGFSSFDLMLGEADVTTSPWVSDSYIPHLDLLQQLLSIPISEGNKQESGRVAKAFDAWVAHELRRAGFPPEAVWPRLTRPRVLGEDLLALEDKIRHLAEQLAAAEESKGKLAPARLRSAINAVTQHRLGTSSAYVLGDFYAKQIDVGMSSWRRGPDLLISTKTMFSAYGKNLKNRHEEAVGEVLSLRRRHPMAAMGYAYLVRQDILSEPRSYATLYDILSRLRRPGEIFDATLLVVVDWDDDNLASGVNLIDQPAPELNAARFYSDLVSAALDRSPNSVHVEARLRRGGSPVGGLEAEEVELDLPEFTGPETSEVST